MLSQNPFPVTLTLLDFLQKNFVSMTLKKAGSAKNSANKSLWINIVCGVHIHNIMCILCFSIILNRY